MLLSDGCYTQPSSSSSLSSSRVSLSGRGCPVRVWLESLEARCCFLLPLLVVIILLPSRHDVSLFELCNQQEQTAQNVRHEDLP